MTEKKMLPEAPASVNIKAVSSKGYDMMFTLRDADETVLLKRLGEYFIKLEDEFHIQPTRKPQGMDAINVSHPTSLPAPPTNVPPTAPNNEINHDATYTFDAERLVGKMEGGKSYWKVQGGKFSKFGVNIWPEVLFAADLKNLDPATVYDLTGYTAYYTLKDNGKEDKVVNLAKE